MPSAERGVHAAPSLRPKDAAKDAAYLGDGEGQISQAAARTAADADHADRADRQGGGKTARLGPHHGEGRTDRQPRGGNAFKEQNATRRP